MRSTRALRHLLLTAAILSVPVATLAQDTTSLDEIVVWGGLTGIAAENFTRAYSAVTAQQIEEEGLTTVAQALRALPGVSVTSTGGSSVSVRIRGGEANYTKVLIDGIEANNPTNGEYSFAGLSTADIESIEVLRGPQSVLYGTSAMSGVIAITTKRADKPGLSYGGGIEVGGHGSHDAKAYVRQRFGRGQLSFSVDSHHDNDNDGSVKGDLLSNKSDTYTLNGDYQLTEAVRAGFTLRRIEQTYGYFATDDYATGPETYLYDAGNSADRSEAYGSLWLEAEAMGGRLLNRVEVSGRAQDTSYTDNVYGDSFDNTARRGFKYTGSFALDGADAQTADQKINLLLEAAHENFKSDSADESRNSRSIALEYQGHYGDGVDVQAGVRHDVIDMFEDPTTWNLSAAWRLPGSALRLRGAVGKAVVYPTMTEQFGYYPNTFIGNPDLKPETSRSYELGGDLDLAEGRGSLGFTLFKARVKDLITTSYTYDAATDSWPSTVTNLAGTSTRQGIELTANWQAQDWLNLRASYTYTDAKGPDGAHLTRRPQNEIGLGATAQAFGGRGSVSADLRYVDGAYDNTYFGGDLGYYSPDYGSLKKLPSFTTVNLAARYELNDNVELTGRVVNLFDEKYSEAWGYYGQRRTLYVGVNTRW